MRERYKTVSQLAQIELEEKKSRFIAICQPLTNEAEANAFVSGIRQAYPDATHHVYAWIIGGETNLQRYSDDGEPQGTAGIPVLEVLRRSDIDQAGIVVTRYFGGTQLGTGGLARAYSRSAAMAMEAARPVEMHLCQHYRIVVGYSEIDRLRRLIVKAGLEEMGCRYEADAALEVAVPLAAVQLFEQICADATNGSAQAEPAGRIYRPLPLPDPPVAATAAN